MWDIIICCDSGTIRLIDGTAGCYWERIFHNVRWTSEDTQEKAEAEVSRLTRWVNPKVRTVWCQPAGTPY